MSLKHLPSITLPMGFADQVLDLQMRLQEEQSLQLIQILSQMYRIGVQYYLEFDEKKAIYFQKKLNCLILKSLNAPSAEKMQNKKQKLSKAFKNQLNKYRQGESTYVKSMMQKSQKNQKKLNDYVKADLNKQQQLFQHRMLKRVKSAGRLL